MRSQRGLWEREDAEGFGNEVKKLILYLRKSVQFMCFYNLTISY